MFKEILVVDDLIDLDTQIKIKETMLGQVRSLFPWFYIAENTGTLENKPALCHQFVFDGKQSSNMYDLILPIVNNCSQHIQQESVEIKKAMAYLHLPFDKESDQKSDLQNQKIEGTHRVFLYNICDGDGDTIIYDFDGNIEKRVKPKQGRCIIINGRRNHTIEHPKNNIRCSMNIDVLCI
jgi:hypothetical protein